MPTLSLSPEAVERVLVATALLLSVALAVLGVWLVRNARTVGRVEVRVRRRFGIRLALLGAYVVCAVTLLVVADTLPKLELALVAGLGFALLALSPGFQDSKFGATGVQRGWHARRFAELEEWRLAGDHLRWKLFGVWVASDLPAERHAAAREKLVALAADRESRFNQ
ncbi:MAG: hypothetical protein L6Q99_10410 [Planctomycetes bacterium]|nr:hypothetical protein [Planctomycetota bacterium]